MKKNSLILLFVFLLAISFAKAQELNFTIQINTSQIQASDKVIYDNMKEAIMDFMNNHVWTSDRFLNQERVECSMLLTINERISSDEFKGTLQVQSRRPAFATSFNTPMLNFNDVDFTFKYVEFQRLEFNENTHLSNLSSVLAFYAYIILGFDYDSFSLYGGNPLFQKAQTISANAQTSQDKGWKPFESTRNRYWLLENLMNTQLKGMREINYKYHRMGLDAMSENTANGRQEITGAIEILKKVHREKPGSLIMQHFFLTKADEIVNIYSSATPEEKGRVFNVLNELDPSNAQKYQKIIKRN